MSTPLSQISEKEVDYFVGFIQTQLHHCMKVKELQDELYCQLIKLSTETHHDNLAVLQVQENLFLSTHNKNLLVASYIYIGPKNYY